MTTETLAWLTASGSVVVHAYQVVVNAGGVKAIIRRFFNGPDKPTA